MKSYLLLCLSSTLLLSGCGGRLGKWELQNDPITEVNSGTGRNYETVTKGGVEFQIERSGAHPAITWPVGPNRGLVMFENLADKISYGDADALTGNKYTFVKECQGLVNRGNENSEGWEATIRIFEYTDKETIYVFRDVDMGGNKFRTFIAVASRPYPSGNFWHVIVQRTNKREEITYCTDPDN